MSLFNFRIVSLYSVRSALSSSEALNQGVEHYLKLNIELQVKFLKIAETVLE